jgi:hypothetical protein
VSSQQAFCAGEHVAKAFVARDGEPQSAGESFEKGFDPVMRRATVHDAEMDVGASSLRESLEKIFSEFGLEVANTLGADFAGDDAVWAAAEIDCGGGERFIHWHQKISGAEDAAFVADGFGDGFAERDAGVFHGVMLVDVEITRDFDREIERAVAGDEVKHVIEEADAGGDFGGAAAVEIKAKADLGFVGLAID